jgi:seryl-tRNA(Sec) selenium transferase
MTGQGAGLGGADDAGAMAGKRPIIVHLPSPTGGRRVRVDGEILGLAHSLRDLVEFLRRAGLEMEPEQVADSPLIDWRGAGPDCWEAETRI